VGRWNNDQEIQALLREARDAGTGAPALQLTIDILRGAR
jgi:hypothetical protein